MQRANSKRLGSGVKKRTKLFLGLLVAAACLVGVGAGAAFAAGGTGETSDDAPVLDPMVLEKTVTPNEDGSYDLNISVQGPSASTEGKGKIDVIVVLDTSGSMEWAADGENDSEKLVQNDKGAYAYISGWNSGYYQLYKKVGSSYVPLADYEDYSGTLYYEGTYRYKKWSGSASSRYLRSSTRLGAAEIAINDMATTLMAYNQKNSEAVRMSLVEFNNTASTVLTNTDSLSSFKSALAGLTAGGGTNWEDGLDEAAGITTREGATKVVVFLTDGDPTYYNSGSSYAGPGSSYSDTGYNRAVTVAKSLISSGADFYAVGAYSSDSRTEKLATDAYGSAEKAEGKYYSAQDSAGLSKAMNEIAKQVASIHLYGYAKVTVTDTIGNLVVAPDTTTGDYEVVMTNAEGEEITPALTGWTVELKEVKDSQGNVTSNQVIWDMSQASDGNDSHTVTVSDGQGGTKTYYVLQEGVTYTLKFKVYPTQGAFDNVAAFANDWSLWEDYQAAHTVGGVYNGDYIYDESTKTFNVYTNHGAEAEYSIAEIDEDGNGTIEEHEPTKTVEDPIIPVPISELEYTKTWSGDDELANIVRPDSEVTLTIGQYDVPDALYEKYADQSGLIYVDVNEAGIDWSKPTDTFEITLNADSQWSVSQTVAAGPVGHVYKVISEKDGANSEGHSVNNYGLPNKALYLKSIAASLKESWTIENIYTVPPTVETETDAVISLGKVISGRDWQKLDNFTFELTQVKATALDGQELTGDLFPTAATDVAYATPTNKTVDFGKITYKVPGTYVYKITETASAISGITISDPVYATVKVVYVDENDQRTMSASVTYSTDADGKNALPGGVITNTYKPASVTLPAADAVRVSKTLVGRVDDEWTDADVYTFEIKAAGMTGAASALSAQPMPASTTATVNKDSKTASFGDITFSEPGTYSYTVQEKESTVAGVSSDSTVYTVTLTVVDQLDGTLKVTEAKYTNPSGTATGETDVVPFTNTYKTSSIEKEFAVSKTLTGRAWQAGESFSFTLTAADDSTPMPEGTVDKVKTISVTKGSEEAATYNASFGKIEYTKVGTYTYKAKEVAGSADGVAYDKTEHTVTVVVKDNGSGELYTETTVDGSPKVEGTSVISYTNVFTSGELEGSVEKGIAVTKSIDGRDWNSTDAFTFTLTALNGAPMPAAGGETATVTKDNKTAAFGTIYYDAAGTYYYTVTENATTIAGMAKDETSYTVAVVVSKNAQTNELTAAVDYNTSYGQGKKSAEFTNKFTPAIIGTDAVAGITVSKTFNVESEDSTRTWTANDKFTFTLKKVTANAPMPANNTITIAGNGTDTTRTADFGEMKFTEAGTYQYTVTEDYTASSAIKGVKYDSRTYEVKVVVSANKTTNALEAAVTYKVGGQAAQSAAFVNTFTSAVLEGTIESGIVIEKEIVTASGPSRGWLEDDAFTFELTAQSGAPEPKGGNTLTITDETPNHKAAFGSITFDAPGQYTYTVAEQATSITGMSTAGKTFAVTVNVADDRTTGKLIISSVTYKPSNSETETSIGKFTNTYTPGELPNTVGTGITVEKKIVDNLGEELEWTEDDTYRFCMTAIGDSPMPENATLVKQGEGTVLMAETFVSSDSENYQSAFDTIYYDKAGVYEYSVFEADSTVPGVAKDGKVYTVTVTVTENETTHALSAAVTSYGEGNANASFTNTFTPAILEDDAISGLGVVKTFTGRDWESDDEFKFTLTAVNKKTTPMPEGSVDGVKTIALAGTGASSGESKSTTLSASFGSVTYYEVGTYNYTIKEDLSAESRIDGVKYDGTVYNVSVIVETDENNKLVAYPVYYVGSTAKGSAAFTNAFNGAVVPGTVEGGIAVSKTLSDIEWTEDYQFSFSISTQNESAPMPADDTITITSATANHTAAFGEMIFNEPGEYIYTVVENETGYDAIPASTDVYTVTVKIVDAAEGLQVESITYKLNGEAADAISFANSYKPGILPGTTEAGIVVTKTIDDSDSGRGWKATDSFTFTLTAVGDMPMPAAGGEKATITGAMAEKTAAFGAISYDEEGTYYYKVTEDASGIAGMSTDETEYNVTVTVSKDENNELQAAVTSYGVAEATSAAFENTFTPGVLPSVVNEGITVTKTIDDQNSGRGWKDSDSFSFTLTQAEGYETAPMPAAGGEKATITGAMETKAAAFGAITYTEAGTYKYVVTEDDTTIQSMSKDATAYTVTVEVTEVEGKLVAEVTSYGDVSASAAAFVNVFTPGKIPSEVGTGITVTKTINDNNSGRGWKDSDSFTFTLAQAQGYETAPMPAAGGEKATITGTMENKTAAFGEILFSEVGTYKYVVTEDDTTIQSMSKDATAYTVTVEVTEVEGKLQAAITSYGVEDASAAAFTNEFTPGKLPSEVGTGITVTKAIDDRDWFDTDSFSFTLAQAEGYESAPMPAAGGENVTITGTMENKTAAFGEILFSEVGTYKYVVTEDDFTGIAGMAKDETAYTVTVSVTEVEGKLVAAITSYGVEEASAAAFMNDFTPGVLPGTTEAGITVTKSIDDNESGRGWKDGDSFSFTLTQAEGYEDAPMPAAGGEKATITGTMATKAAAFGSISYNKAGEYKYVVTEDATSIDGMTKNDTSYTVTVTVTEEAGELVAAVTSYGEEGASSAAFTNEFTPGVLPSDVEKGIAVSKTVVDAEAAAVDWSDKTFTFQIAADAQKNPNAPLPAETTLQISGSAASEVVTKAFGDIKFDTHGTYYYTITEQASPYAQIIKDSTVYTAVVEVQKNEETNELTASVSFQVDGQAADAISFTNTYKPGILPGTTEDGITVTKTLNDNDSGRGWKESDSFSFTLAPAQGYEDAPMPAAGGEKATVTKDSRTVAFGEIAYDAVGEYHYTITEDATQIPGIAVNETAYDVTVSVALVEGALQAEVTSYGEVGAQSAAFENEFTPVIIGTETTAGITVNKTFTGRTWTANDQFKFQLTATGDAPMPEGDGTITIVGDGESTALSGAFGAMRFNEIGTYEYTVTELDTGISGVTYSQDVYTVVVTVAAKQDTNELYATINYKLGETGKTAISFANTYKAGEIVSSPTDAVDGVTLTKYLDGRTMTAADVFGFKMVEVFSTSTVDVETVYADVTDGSLEFSPITYTEAGTHQYAITEVVPAGATQNADGTWTLNGVTYDNKTYTITTTITDNLEGQLEASHAITAVNGQAVDPATSGSYTNKYDKKTIDDPTIGGITAKVVLNGHAMEAGQFKANVVAADQASAAKFAGNGSNPYQSAQAEAGVKAEWVLEAGTLTQAFGAIEITREDVGKTYTWTVTEEAETVTGYTYDTASHVVKIYIANYDTDTNLFDVDITVDGEDTNALVITNTYKALPAELGDGAFEVTKTFTGRAWGESDKFNFKVEAAGMTGVPVAIEQPMPENDAIEIGKPDTGDTNKASFGKITFTEPGVYSYTVSETGTPAAGVSYDTPTYQVTITVTDNNGQLEAVVAYGEKGEQNLAFANTYTTGETSVVFDVTKVLECNEGTWASRSDVFTFDLKDVTDEANPTVVETLSISKPDEGCINMGSFAAITYKQADVDKTFTYNIVETSEPGKGVEVDETVQVITVTVRDNGLGELYTELTVNGESAERVGVQFNNCYTAAEVTGTPLGVAKTLKNTYDGRTREWTEADVFTFTLQGANEDTPMPEGTVAGIKTITIGKPASGLTNTGDFGEITYLASGQYTYYIAEKDTGLAEDIKADVTAYTTVVTVKDNGEGNLVVDSVTYNAKAAEAASFTNEYSPIPVTISFDMHGHGTQVPDQNIYKHEKVSEPKDFVAGKTVVTEGGNSYRFDGWYTSDGFQVKYNFDNEVLADTVLHSKWTQIFDVSFDLNGHGSPKPENQVVDEGKKIAEPTTPTDEAYDFTGWYISKEAADANDPAGLYDFTTPVAGDVELYAGWAIKTFSIEWKDWDGTVLDVETYTYGETPLYKKDTPTRKTDGSYEYEFAGWDPAIHVVNGNDVYVAKYTQKGIVVPMGDANGTLIAGLIAVMAIGCIGGGFAFRRMRQDGPAQASGRHARK